MGIRDWGLGISPVLIAGRGEREIGIISSDYAVEGRENREKHELGVCNALGGVL